MPLLPLEPGRLRRAVIPDSVRQTYRPIGPDRKNEPKGKSGGSWFLTGVHLDSCVSLLRDRPFSPEVSKDLGLSGHVRGAGVERGTRRQRPDVPKGVTGPPRQGHPVVALDERLAGRTGAGVVTDASALHVWGVASGRGVVQGERPVVAG